MSGDEGDLINRFRSNCGQVKSGNGFQEAADRLEEETTYTLRQRFSLFVSSSLNGVWTRPASCVYSIFFSYSAMKYYGMMDENPVVKRWFSELEISEC